MGAGGVLLTGVSTLWAGFKIAEWAAGVATMPGNVTETQLAIVRILNRISEQDPNTSVLVGVAALFMFGLVLMSWAIRRSQPVPMDQISSPFRGGRQAPD